MLIIGNGLTCVRAGIHLLYCFLASVPHTLTQSLWSPAEWGKGAPQHSWSIHASVCESACFARQRSVFVWLKERMCVCVRRQVCVEHAAYQWRFAQQLCTDTVSGRGMERGLGWGEERERASAAKRKGEGESDSPDWGRDAESRRRGPLDFCQGFPATAEVGIDSFFPSSQGICLFRCLPWEFCQWASGREERKSVEERSAAERNDVPPPSLDAEVKKWGLPWREVEKKDEKLIAVLGYKHISFRQVNGRAKLWEVNHWWRAPWKYSVAENASLQERYLPVCSAENFWGSSWAFLTSGSCLLHLVAPVSTSSSGNLHEVDPWWQWQ